MGCNFYGSPVGPTSTHHRDPRPGDPLQRLPGALGDGFPCGGVVDRFGVGQGENRKR
jgi:hypothetical protein